MFSLQKFERVSGKLPNELNSALFGVLRGRLSAYRSPLNIGPRSNTRPSIRGYKTKPSDTVLCPFLSHRVLI
jgi:hypothetical protein